MNYKPLEDEDEGIESHQGVSAGIWPAFQRSEEAQFGIKIPPYSPHQNHVPLRFDVVWAVFSTKQVGEHYVPGAN